MATTTMNDNSYNNNWLQWLQQKRMTIATTNTFLQWLQEIWMTIVTTNIFLQWYTMTV